MNQILYTYKASKTYLHILKAYIILSLLQIYLYNCLMCSITLHY